MNLSTIVDAKTFECDCGGKIFRQGVVFKRISALLAESGKEELYTIEVVICEKCGKVPSEFNRKEMLPPEVLATKSIIK